MTITFPRPLPSTRILGVYFELEFQEAFSPETSGKVASTELGPPFWVFKLNTRPPSELEFSKWRAWLSSLRGAGRRFYGYDARRPLPLLYRSGFSELTRAVSGGVFNGLTSAWSASEAGDVITLGDDTNQELPVGFNLIEGDYIGLKWETHKRSLHRVLESSNADANGVGSWTIEPPVHHQIPAEAVVTLTKPDCLMTITQRDSDAEHKDRRVSFEARSDLEL